MGVERFSLVAILVASQLGFAAMSSARAAVLGLTGAELVSDPNVTSIGNLTLDGAAAILQNNGIGARATVLTIRLYAADPGRTTLDVTLTVDYSCVSSDCDPGFGLIDGTRAAGFVHADNDSGTVWTQNSADPNFPGIGTPLQAGLDPLEPISIRLQLSQGGPTIATFTEGGDSVTTIYNSLALDPTQALEFYISSDDNGEIYRLAGIGINTDAPLVVVDPTPDPVPAPAVLPLFAIAAWMAVRRFAPTIQA